MYLRNEGQIINSVDVLNGSPRPYGYADGKNTFSMMESTWGLGA